MGLILRPPVCLHILPLILFSLFSCTGYVHHTESSASHIIENVPFYPQQAYQCGPSSLAGVLNFWGVAVSPAEIAADIYSESAKGTLDVDMIFYAERKGLEARQYEGSIDDIKRNVNSCYPMIVLVDYGFWIHQRNHFMVIIGYNENGVIANSGRERLKFISFHNFLSAWRRTKFWTMLVSPKPREKGQ
jgi:predicted double-glycine peptidase